ncbi:DUF2147 domain-containing protein [Daejeonella lutea]|uniref:DUF2147 domain-containing protein n=1 Tax=Daejeonella lutea TaxID=572036 RepID=A0A1T5B6E1_9SPHI|nr:DUF2147 domain-containing protein [Daejeonella lutea]SKB42796.1 hypothetical protein SAMN05661099_1349 [Daejeonella lutea]
MKFKILLAFLAPICFILPSMAQSGDAVLGVWQSGGGNVRVQIFKSGQTYNGKISWLREENDESGNPKTDKHNPSESRRGQPLLGLEALSDFNYSGNGVWEGGTVYDPRSGKKYSCKLSISNGGALEIRAFMGISLIGKTQVWTRVK